MSFGSTHSLSGEKDSQKLSGRAEYSVPNLCPCEAALVQVLEHSSLVPLSCQLKLNPISRALSVTAPS